MRSFLIPFFVFLLLCSCRHDDEQRLAAEKDAKKQERIYVNIDRGWHFTTPALNPKTQELVSGWSELRQFSSELAQKPQSSIGAFQKKAKELSKKALDLNHNIPIKFNKPEIKSRISVLLTKVNSVNLFINLQQIPDQKVVALVSDINIELASLYRQLDEIVRKEDIPRELGESDMIRMLDTARAIRSTPTNTILPKR